MASEPGEPALPRYVANVDVPGNVLRGVGFRSGAFTEQRHQAVHRRAGHRVRRRPDPFTSPTFYPARMWAASYFAELSGGATSLAVTPAQHRVVNVGDPTATRRLYTSLGLRLFYAGENDADAALATAPAISDVQASLTDRTVAFSARVHGTDDDGDDNLKTAWVDLHLRPDRVLVLDIHRPDPSAIDSTIWTGT